MKLYTVKTLKTDNDAGGSLDDIEVSCEVSIAESEEKAKDIMREIYEQEIFDLLDIDDEEEYEDEDDGYSDHYINDTDALVSVWNQDGTGTRVEIYIEEVEI